MRHSRLLSLALLCTPALVLSGCAKKYTSQTAAPALGGDAEIVIKQNSTKTYDIEIEVANLLPPERVGDYKGYGVWVVTKDAAPVKLGMLAYDEGDRAGELQATTPLRAFDLHVTLESDPAAVTPSNVVVVQQPVKARK